MTASATSYAYLVLNDDEPDPERQGLRAGTQALHPAGSTESLAMDIAQETRLLRNHFGSMSIGVWPADTAPTPVVALRDAEMPPVATIYSYGAVTHRTD